MSKETRDEIRPSAAALLPFAAFMAIYLGAGLILQAQGVEMAFYQFPPVTAMFIAVMLAFAMTDGSFGERFRIFSRGAANEGVIMMLVIYILAGAFSGVAAAMGGRDATVNLGLSVVPAQYLAAGIFVISAFMGTATGTSMGTIGAIVPVAVGVADKGDLSLPLVVGACIGGAMFGDNLSMISDTTIAATRTQGCAMKDKFKLNFLIALPAAIITVILLIIFGQPETAADIGELAVSPVKVLPYLVVLILALCGVNVFLVLTGGIFLAGVIGMATGSFDIFGFAQNVWNGFIGMNEVFFLTLFCAGMSELVTHNGGIVWLIGKLQTRMKDNKSAQLGISTLAALTDCATANNTVAIVVTGNVARDVSRAYRVDPRKTASLLDIFSCIVQGFLPYGAQMLSATVLINAFISEGVVTPFDIIPYIWYIWILLIFALISIFVPYADGEIRRHPWKWEVAE